MKKLVAASLVMSICIQALASEDDLNHCISTGPSSTQAQCIDDVFTRENKRLNQNYKALLAKFGDDRALVGMLRDAQRKWLAFRNSDCEFSRSREGGTLGSLAFAYCRAKHTIQRADDLK